jgi:hypothetical protein
VELRAIKDRRPELADAVDMHLALIELHRRVQSRIPLPAFELTTEKMTRHVAEARPLLRFEDIPLDVTDLRLLVRQTAEVLHRSGTLDAPDFTQVQMLGRDVHLLALAGDWYRTTADRHAKAAPGNVEEDGENDRESAAMDQVLALAMQPFLARCAEVLQPRAELAMWTHGHCALCGGEPDLSVITPAAERHLICSRCTLRWNFEPLTCPYCRNPDRGKITSFATAEGTYRVYACDACRRYLKAYDARRASRPVMPVVDLVATLPLDAAAMQRGYRP